MCDTIVIIRNESVWFAKNSDRDPNEAQCIEWHPRREHSRGARLACTWIEIPQAAETHAVAISRPFWMWGAEMGANEHGVVIGNEAVFTRQPYVRTGLTGMDLVRLALERSSTAREACDVIARLLEEFGQGGGCGYENRAFTYHNSFLIADSLGAFVFETAGRQWAVEPAGRVRAISNGLTIPGFAEKHSDFLYTRISRCRTRRERTEQLASACENLNDLFALLRDHGQGRSEPRYSPINGGMAAPCMHAGGMVAASQTTSSWVAELHATGARHWVTGTAAPCTGLFKPLLVGQPLAIGPLPGASPDDSLWWRHERFHRAVLRDPARYRLMFAPERDAVESAWTANPPDPPFAWAEGDRLLAEWTEAISEETISDRRPFWVRRYWARRRVC